MPGRSQVESEQPAKVYQLDAVDKKVDDVLVKIDQLLSQTSGLVTVTQLSITEKGLQDKIDEEVEKIHLKYGPTQRNASWLMRALIVEGIAIVGQAIILWMIAKN